MRWLNTLLGAFLWWGLSTLCTSGILLFYEGIARPRDHTQTVDEDVRREITRTQNRLSIKVGLIVAAIYYIAHSWIVIR